MLNRAASHIGIFFLYALSLLPLPLLYVVADGLYLLVYHVFGYRRKVVRTNLMLSFPEKDLAEIDRIEKRFYKYLASLIVEIIKLSTISQKELERRCSINTSQIDPYLKRGESVLICSAHYGNWEWGSVAFGARLKGNAYPIYKPLSNAAFDKWFYTLRSRFGNHMIAMKQTFRMLSETKDQATAFCFASDQAPPNTESQYWLTFLNQHTSVPLGLEKIALKTNRPIFFIALKYIKRGYYQLECVLLCADPSKTNGHEISQLHTRLLENIIKEEPAYWLWSHRRWKHQPILLPAAEVL
jgi:KDO2-lipid IV(A) lauroyltransferase